MTGKKFISASSNFDTMTTAAIQPVAAIPGVVSHGSAICLSAPRPAVARVF